MDQCNISLQAFVNKITRNHVSTREEGVITLIYRDKTHEIAALPYGTEIFVLIRQIAEALGYKNYVINVQEAEIKETDAFNPITFALDTKEGKPIFNGNICFPKGGVS